jgi:hypothetical protein
MRAGTLTLDRMDGQEISPGIILIGEPIPVPGTSRLRALANVRGMLAVVELRITFPAPADRGAT